MEFLRICLLFLVIATSLDRFPQARLLGSLDCTHFCLVTCCFSTYLWDNFLDLRTMERTMRRHFDSLFILLFDSPKI